MNISVLRKLFILFLLFQAVIADESSLYKSDPAIKKIINELPINKLVKLPKPGIFPVDVKKYHSTFSKGPGKRDFCNKISYAPDRETGMYAGANHNVPHRLTDVWEFHLASNSWHLICKPGLNGTKLNFLNKKLKKNKDDEKVKEQIKKWYEGVEFKDGYIHDKITGGPVQAWHTWDGITYDEESKILMWNVLEVDNHKHERFKRQKNLVIKHAKRHGLKAEELVKQIKPGSGVYLYRPDKGRWIKQMGDGPFPRSIAMGATLHYIPTIKKTISYVCAGNRPGGYVEGMWAYDSKINKWELLIKGNKVSGMMKKGIAPGSELQVAFSDKDNKLVAICKNTSYIYDVAKNTWQQGAKMEAYGHDRLSVFVYDKKSDKFLMFGRKGKSHFTHEPWSIYVYDLKSNKWNEVSFEGKNLVDDSKRKGWLKYGFAGYYDYKENAFVLYEGRYGSIFVYRHSN